jgi:hypothetical protein
MSLPSYDPHLYAKSAHVHFETPFVTQNDEDIHVYFSFSQFRYEDKVA